MIAVNLANKKRTSLESQEQQTAANMLINNKLSAAISINVGPSTPLPLIQAPRSKGAARRSNIQSTCRTHNSYAPWYTRPTKIGYDFLFTFNSNCNGKAL